uniref:Uncharacterized protein n=1 Tax=Octopus bimaculoides TaxID=37653 RepID=A0A0L8HPC1_OCTBM
MATGLSFLFCFFFLIKKWNGMEKYDGDRWYSKYFYEAKILRGGALDDTIDLNYFDLPTLEG